MIEIGLINRKCSNIGRYFDFNLLTFKFAYIIIKEKVILVPEELVKCT